jgi:plastocyanin
MHIRGPVARMRRPIAVSVAAGVLTGLGAYAGLTLPSYDVSQKGREFRPGEVIIKRGETVQIINDDGDLQHHAYVDSAKFNFDSGDQEPGAKASITFPTVGDFSVLCAIHPKMKLVVHVK